LTLKLRLFGKFFAAPVRGDILRTLFIKLEFILSEWSACMVNRTCFWFAMTAAARRERGIKRINPNLERNFAGKEEFVR
jgi:hypothetical protein